MCDEAELRECHPSRFQHLVIDLRNAACRPAQAQAGAIGDFLGG
jgi:hypothetical protein